MNKLKDPNICEKERIKFEVEKRKIKDQEESYKKKEQELEERERIQPWNVDTIGHEAWSKSIINKPKDKSEATKSDIGDESCKKMMKYIDDNEHLLKKLSTCKNFDMVEKLLLEQPHLASEYASNWLTIEALNMGIEEKYDEMDVLAENCITVQYLLELSKSLHALATNTNVIANFFKKIRLADPSYMKMYFDEVDAFKGRLRKRAKDKRDAAINEYEAEERAKRIAESPGGLDPQVVLESLPEAMQEAFRTQSIERMYEVAEKMDAEVFQHHLQRCVDSGLWIPNAKEYEESKKATESTEQ